MRTPFALVILALNMAGQMSLLAQTPRAPTIQWQRVLGGSSDDKPVKIVEADDGSFFVGGVSLSEPSGNKTSPLLDVDLLPIDSLEVGDMWVVKLDRTGAKQWDRSYGGLGGDALVDLAPTSDGGVFIGGGGFRGEVIRFEPGEPFQSYAFFEGSKDYLLARADATGHTLWQQFYGGDEDESLVGLFVGPDKSVILAGWSSSSPGVGKTAPLFGSSDAWIVGVDPSGNPSWDRSFGGTMLDSVNQAKRTSDGGMILAGPSHSGADGNKSSPGFGLSDVWVVRLNAAGEKIWEQSLGGEADEHSVSLFTMPDGGAIVGCVSSSLPSGNKTSPLLDEGLSPLGIGGDIWLVRLDSSGRILWDTTVGTTNLDLPIALEATPEGGVIVCTYSFPPYIAPNEPYDLHVTKVGSDGNKIWDTSYTSTFDSFFFISAVVAIDDGGVLLGIASKPGSTIGNAVPANYGGFDCWLLRLDAQGNKAWDLTLGSMGQDLISTLNRTKDGGFIVGMSSETVSTGNNGNKAHRGYGLTDMWVVKLSPELPPDSDGDGVPDAQDSCPNTPQGEIVNVSGCSIEQLVRCDGPWKNHGQYVRAVVMVSKQFRKAGLLTHRQRLAIFFRAVQSDCGKHTRGNPKHVPTKG